MSHKDILLMFQKPEKVSTLMSVSDRTERISFHVAKKQAHLQSSLYVS